MGFFAHFAHLFAILDPCDARLQAPCAIFTSVKTAIRIIAFSFLLPCILKAQTLQPESIGVEQGLSQSTVFDVLQDREGFLWAATKDGLNRYDGYQFKVFTNDPYDPFSLSNNTVTTLFEDSKGRIWAGTENAGLCIFNKKTGRFHRIQHHPGEPNGLSGHKINKICEDANGNILVAVEGAGLNVLPAENDYFDGGQLPIIRQAKLPAGVNVVGLVKDAKGRTWVGSMNAIYRFETTDFSVTMAAENFGFERAWANADGSIWMVSDQHPPFLWDGQKVLPLFKGISAFDDIIARPDGMLWVAQYRGLRVFDLEKLKPGVPALWNDAPAEATYPVFLTRFWPDQNGSLWAGTLGFGLRKFTPSRNRFRHEAPGYSVSNIIPDADDAIWFGSYPCTWRRRKHGNWESNRPDQVLFSEAGPENIYRTKSGEYWILDEFARLFRIKKDGSMQRLPFNDPDFKGKQPMLEDSKGNIWLSGFSGKLLRVEPATGRLDNFNFSDPSNPMPPMSLTTALYEDAGGTIWIGSQSGFVKMTFADGKPVFTWFRNNPNDRNSLNYNHVSCFLDDPAQPDQYLWICTKGGGLNRMDKHSGAFLHLTTDNGLPNNVVYGLLADAEGHLWGSTNRGLFCLIKDVAQKTADGQPTFVFRNFTQADGLQHDEFNTGAYAKLPDGKLAFGGINGVNIFDSKEILSNVFQPNVFITNILINGKEVLPGDKSGVLQSTIETAERITLSYQQDILTLEFAALDLSVPGQNRYRYQLTGVHEDWVESGTRRSATYLHLRPGDYTFRVQGTNSQGVWSPHIAELHIRVLPPWWRTWWAYSGYLLLLVAGVRTYFRFSVNRAKLKEQLAFETREAERVKDLDAVKTQLYTNITHEFRTPLTVILGMARQVLDNPGDNLRNGLEMIIRNGNNLLKLVNEMLDLSKLESGKMALQPVQGDVIGFLRYLVESFHSLASNQQKQLHFLSGLDSLTMDFDPDKLQQIISNLLSNALKFTPEGGNIYMSVSSGPEAAGNQDALPQTLIIKVKDTGIGIPEEQLPFVFDRFYQASHPEQGAAGSTGGTGIGLALSRELVKLMEGDISVKSPPVGARNGAEFTVVLPVFRSTGQAAPRAFTIESLISLEPTSLAKPVNPKRVPTVKTPVPSAANRHQPMILLVEDNADVVAYTASCLTGYRFVVGVNGEEGLAIAREQVPDLIISDVMMPVMNGFELTRELRLDERTSHIPVILLTAKADMESKLEGLERGADAYLEKPFHKEELLLRISKLLEMRQQLQRHYQRLAGLGSTIAADQPPVAVEQPEDAFVRKVREVVEAHLEDFEFSVEHLCRAVHLSQSQLQRKMDALTGLSPNQFIRSLRLRRAQELLRDPERSITAVAFDCGYNDPGYFSRIFKQEFGVTPGEWRESG